MWGRRGVGLEEAPTTAADILADKWTLGFRVWGLGFRVWAHLPRCGEWSRRPWGCRAAGTPPSLQEVGVGGWGEAIVARVCAWV